VTEILLVNGTNLQGVIRDSFEPFHSLRFVDLSKNLLTGPLPSSIFNSDVLEILYLSFNALTGSIPANYGNASKLTDLYVNDNKLTGMVPPIGPNKLQNLTEFLLEHNAITGTMPASICALRGMNPKMDLVNLIADCGGAQPLIQCDCCNSCF
jgi:Leucine-rich repeat (LRR) protein